MVETFLVNVSSMSQHRQLIIRQNNELISMSELILTLPTQVRIEENFLALKLPRSVVSSLVFSFSIAYGLLA
jgi:hypothetical protein